MKKAIVFLLIILCYGAKAQTVKGKVMDKITHEPLRNAYIFVSGNTTYTATTDTTGDFTVTASTGKYTLIAECEGHRTVVKEIVIKEDKEQTFEIELPASEISLTPVTVHPKKENIEIELWKVQQYAAVFYDPARMVNSNASAVNTDDQANNVSVHGTTPGYIQWKMEGVEVVNPNHLENAGTLNDRPSLNGGGVSLISAQLLQNSEFRFAPFDAQSGNALSGIFDMKLRNGTEKRMEGVVQASLLGTDVSLEGPFSKKSKATYLFNLRYSTIGILSAIGVNFGDEKTNFKDASYVLFFPHKYGSVKLFGMTGNSETTYDGKKDGTLAEVQKELQNITYNSLTTINGISNIITLSNTLYLKTVIAYSTKNINRTAVASSDIILPSETDNYEQDKLSSVMYISKRLGNSFNIKAGTYVNYFFNKINSSTGNTVYAFGNFTERVYQPFISATANITQHLEVEAGLHSMYLPRINNFSLQPRARVKYIISDRQDISFNYGISSQLQAPYLYLSNADNINLSPTLSTAYSMLYRLNVHNTEIKNELYYQTFKDIPVQPGYNFSAFNYFNEQINFPLIQTGHALVYGYALSVEKRYKGFYGIVSASIFNNTYTIAGIEQKARFNSGYNTFLTCGKEWRLKSKRSYVSIGLRTTLRNGFKETTVTNSYLYNSQLPVYYRTDARISYRKNKTRSTVIWALDIQNVTNSKNVTYNYYDIVTHALEPRYQLGLIPVLSYKVLF